MAAKARGVQFGKPAPKAETVETKVRQCRQMMAEEMSSVEAAEAVNWSRPRQPANGLQPSAVSGFAILEWPLPVSALPA